MNDALADLAMRAFVAATMLPTFMYLLVGPDTLLIAKSLMGDTDARAILRSRPKGAQRIVGMDEFFARSTRICIWTAGLQLVASLIWPLTVIGLYPLFLCCMFSLIASSVAVYLSIRKLTIRPLLRSWLPLIAFPATTLYVLVVM